MHSGGRRRRRSWRRRRGGVGGGLSVLAVVTVGTSGVVALVPELEGGSSSSSSALSQLGVLPGGCEMRPFVGGAGRMMLVGASLNGGCVPLIAHHTSRVSRHTCHTSLVSNTSLITRLTSHNALLPGNTLAAAAATLHPRIQLSDGNGSEMSRDEVYAALEAGGEQLSVDAAVALGGGGRILMPVGEREALRGMADDADAAAASDAGSYALQPRTLQDICSDILIPPALA